MAANDGESTTAPSTETSGVNAAGTVAEVTSSTVIETNNNNKVYSQEKNNNSNNNNNLIINYLPNALTDDELYEIFERVGPLNSAKIMRNKMTGYSYGYGFVSYVSPADAAAAIRQLDGAQLHHKRLKVAYCRRSGGGGSDNVGAAEIKNANLFVANLPSNFTEDQLETAFGKYGEIVRSKILLDHATGVSKGCGFVLFSKTAEADAALSALHGQLLDVAGFCFTHPLIVKKAKDENRAASSSSSGATSGGHPSHRSRPIHVIHHYAHSSESAAKDARGGVVVDQNGGVSGGGVVVQGYKYPNAVDAVETPQQQQAQEQIGTGHTLYVYGIGSVASELDLYALFAPFGAIVKVYVMRDPATRSGKGFGFVTYGDYHDACVAVQTLNGYPFHKNSMRPLQVSFKTPKSSSVATAATGGSHAYHQPRQ